MGEAEDTVQRCAVLATCGCGHDGRLGFGEPLHPQDLLSTSRVTLIPFFMSTLANSGDQIRSVHCGGYHTIALTEAGALYGWGAHEDGQLGFGRQNKAPRSTPTRLPFFDELYDAESKEGDVGERKDFILDVSCGAEHSMVLTQTGLYVTGKNTFGQLGVGTDEDIFEWVSLSSILTGGRRLHRRSVASAESMALSPPASHSRQKNFMRLLQGEVTHISCGTHHSLMAWKNVVAERNADPDATQPVTLEFYPLLLLASGKGDFGELGYNGDAMSVLHATEKRQHTALHAEARRTMMQGGVNTDDNGNTSICPQPYTVSWWQARQRKERRPEFFSMHFLPVDFPLLNEGVARAPLSSTAMDVMLEAQQSASPQWEVDRLAAEHLHSTLTLRSVVNGEQVVYHWGCFYCGEVEGMQSSIPVMETWAPSLHIALHAGNEVLFRYRCPPDTASPSEPVITVKGAGILGTGEEDCFETSWVPVLHPEGAWASVRRIDGRDHFLVLVVNGAGETEVWGFGANLHGQLGDSEEDSVVTPVPQLRQGDRVTLPSSHTVAVPDDCNGEWEVLRVRDAGAGVRHSVYLLDVKKVA